MEDCPTPVLCFGSFCEQITKHVTVLLGLAKWQEVCAIGMGILSYFKPEK